MNIELIAITERGELARQPKSALPPVTQDIIQAVTELYGRVGYQPPWIGYLAFDSDQCVGTGGFKSPPEHGRLEIAYFTLPEHESRGVATNMASQLTRLACQHLPDAIVAAQTLPTESASTAILKKLDFRLIGTVEHPEDGPVWEWQFGHFLDLETVQGIVGRASSADE